MIIVSILGLRLSQPLLSFIMYAEQNFVAFWLAQMSVCNFLNNSSWNLLFASEQYEHMFLWKAWQDLRNMHMSRRRKICAKAGCTNNSNESHLLITRKYVSLPRQATLVRSWQFRAEQLCWGLYRVVFKTLFSNNRNYRIVTKDALAVMLRNSCL